MVVVVVFPEKINGLKKAAYLGHSFLPKQKMLLHHQVYSSTVVVRAQYRQITDKSQ